MPKAKVSDEDFIELFEQYGANETARKLNVAIRNVFERRRRIEERYGRQLKAPDRRNTRHGVAPVGRLEYTVKNGVVLIGSDAHYWPHYIGCAHRAFVHFCKKLSPKIVILNGDMIDGATISRWPIGINRDHLPSVVQEIETVTERLMEIERAAPNAKKVWPLGNHDARFETRLGVMAADYAKVHGFTLKDHFPYWFPCWSAWLNDDVVVKHRFKGGIHARHNNTVWAGKSICSGHLHRLGVTPFTDYTGTRYGIECGTLADIYGPQFEYREDNPVNHQSGFVVLTFKDDRLLHPEVVRVVDDEHVEWRGELIKI